MNQPWWLTDPAFHEALAHGRIRTLRTCHACGGHGNTLEASDTGILVWRCDACRRTVPTTTVDAVVIEAAVNFEKGAEK